MRRPIALGARLAWLLGLLLTACAASTAQPAANSQLPTALITLATAPPAAPTPQPTAPPATPTPAPTAPPATPTPPQRWRFVVLGDTRTEGLKPPEVTYQIVERAAQAQPAIVLALGDLIYAMDTREQVRQQWQSWREAVAPLGANPERGAPWLLPTPGNHDVQGHSWATDLFAEAFSELPSNGPPGLDRRAYALDYGGVRFISLDSERFEAMHLLDDAQLGWLEAELRDNPNRFTIVFSHDPAFPVGPHAGSSLDAYPQARDRFWKLLRDYHATAYFAGHEHLYNRRAIDGVQQIIAGTSGSFVYSGFGGEFYHYLVGEVGADAIDIVVYDQGGQERDRFTLPAATR